MSFFIHLRFTKLNSFFVFFRQTEKFPRLQAPLDWFVERFDIIKKTVPAFLRPKYFAMVINVAFKAARDRVVEQYSPLIREGPSFTVDLALTSVQMYGQVKSASLDSKKETPSLAAGLPHFTAGVSYFLFRFSLRLMTNYLSLYLI